MRSTLLDVSHCTCARVCALEYVCAGVRARERVGSLCGTVQYCVALCSTVQRAQAREVEPCVCVRVCVRVCVC